MKTNLKMIIFSAFLASPLFFAPIATAATGNVDNSVDNQIIKKNNNYETRSVNKPHLADGSYGAVRLSVYIDYNVGAPYPATLYNYAHWYTPSQKYVYGNLSVSDFQYINGKLRVWYSGYLT